MVAADFTDPENARTILMAAGGLVVLAVLLAAGTVWWWRTTKVEHPALAPLEVMSSRRWAQSGAHEQEAQLDLARPDGDEDPEPWVPAPAPAADLPDDAEPDLRLTDAEVEVERDLDHHDQVAVPVLFDQDVHDASDAQPVPEVPLAQPAPQLAPLDPLLAPRRPE